ncbi:hypothetical protein BGZ81_005813 [Podila clonocystis]|nr:hypothetical protein BGZ81_005813 [Podila clonocystis]
MAVELGFFEREGVVIERVCCPSGTGEMTAKLIDGSLDVAIALTEGLLAGIAKGHNAYKIIGTYVESPLCWAISVGQESKHVDRKSLRNGTIGISRIGSGSHIIPYVLAEQEGWLEDNKNNESFDAPFDFKVLNTFKHMRDSVNDGSSDAFLWERFTTKPYHDSNEVRSVDTITPPWPAFMIAASIRHLPSTDDRSSKESALSKFLTGLTKATEHFVDPHNYEASVQFVQTKMSYTRQDVQDWFSGVRYPKRGCAAISKEALVTCSRILLEAGVINKAQEEDIKAQLSTKYVDTHVTQLV